MVASVGLDLFAGSVGGAAGVIVGQPLDVIKVRYQVSSLSPSLSSTSGTASGSAGATGRASYASVVAGIWRARGVRGFFRGLGPPVCGQALYSAVSFAGFNGCLAAIAMMRGDARVAEGQSPTHSGATAI